MEKNFENIFFFFLLFSKRIPSIYRMILVVLPDNLYIFTQQMFIICHRYCHTKSGSFFSVSMTQIDIEELSLC